MPPKGSKKKAATKSKGQEEVVAVEDKPVEVVPEPVTEATPTAPESEPAKEEETQPTPTPETEDATEKTASKEGTTSSSSNGAEKKTTSATDIKDRLFQLRLKINQGRQANKAEVEEEYKRFSDGKKRYRKDQDEDGDDGADKKNGKQKWTKKEGELMNQTAEEAEWVAEKNRKKQETAATFGLNAFTEESTYRAYEKRVNKLATTNNKGSSSSAEADHNTSKVVRKLADNPFDYGVSNAGVSQTALDKLSKDVIDREEQRRKFSRRKVHVDGDVDYINDRNAKFNKKLDRAFDKYTVEIRQNLERGTAI